jgi:N-acetylglucosamine-6-phosphate deacetylase
MANQLIINARLPGYNTPQNIVIDAGKIQAIAPSSEAVNKIDNCRAIDLKGDWLSLGGIDLQINGGLGLAFNALEFKNLAKIEEICQFLWLQGIDGFLPTLVTTSIENIKRSLAVIAQFMQTQKSDNTALILGVHLEGPFLNDRKRGAHPAEHLLPLTIENLQQILGIHGDIVKIITLAPELDTTNRAIGYLIERGITVSLGHSLATEEQARSAFALGASMVTHAFNAMPGLHHRQPGLLAAAMVDPDVYCGLIADGNHVSQTMMKILLRTSNVFLVSDALAPMGLPDGIYPWDTRKITVTQGTARLPDGTLSGTTLPLLTGVKNLVEWGICDPERAIALATKIPATAIAIPDLTVGQPARFIRWHCDRTQKLTWNRLDLSKKEKGTRSKEAGVISNRSEV